MQRLTPALLPTMHNWWVDGEGYHRPGIHKDGNIFNGATAGRNPSTVDFHAPLHCRIHRPPTAIPTPQHSHQAQTPIAPSNQLHLISNHDPINHPIPTSELALVKLRTMRWINGRWIKLLRRGVNIGKYYNDLTMSHIFHLP